MILTRRKSTAKQLIFAFAASIVVTVAFLVGHQALAAGEVFSVVSNKITYENQAVNIWDLQVNGTGDDQLNMNLYVSYGSLQFGTTEGLSFDGPNSGSTIQFEGTRSAINAALSTLTYNSDTPGTYTIEATLGGADGDVYNPANGHVYKVAQVTGEGINWDDARVAAQTPRDGVPGYLATITSQEEQDFILDRISQDGWIGANDVAVEGEWRWVTGPEANMLFWNGNGETGSPVDSTYVNWNQSGGNVEPNNGGDTENCAEVRFSDGASGEWNDRDCDATNMAYVVEYGAPGNLPAVASKQFNVTVNVAPAIVISKLSPADNSTVVSAQDLAITFNQPMTLQELYFKVYDASDDSMVAELWDNTTENGFTFVHHLDEPLAPGDYYVTMSDSGMKGLVDYYHGFDDKTTWNFTVAENGGISAEVEDAAPNGGDANNDSIKDSLQANVASYVNPTTGEYAVLEVDAECSIVSVGTTAESSATTDGAYTYPAGLMNFELNCGTPGFVATVKQYYYGETTGGLVVRKYNPTTGAYFTINSATVTQQTINGEAVTVASYAITDGGELDLDGAENGAIVDPAGLALSEATVPNTGIKPAELTSYLVAGGIGGALIALTGLYGYRFIKKRA